MFQKLKTYGVLVITILLLLLVIRKVGLAELYETLIHADIRWVIFSILLSPFVIFTGVIKWKILLASQGIEVPIWRLYALYLVGKFFNNFLPSTVGGDVVRGYELGKNTQDGATAMASVFMERFTGLIVLVIMAMISFLTYLRLVQDYRLLLAMGFAFFGSIIVLWLILDSRPINLLTSRFKIPYVKKYYPKLQKFHASLNAYRNHRKALVLSIIWSFVFMFLAILNVYASARAFYSPISFLEIAVIVPVILVVAMVPLTFNGLGIQEWAYVILFTWAGLPASVGLSTIILIRAKDIFLAIIGGFLYPAIKISMKSGVSETHQDRPISS